MYEVFAYWNVSELTTVFNAVAALTATNDYMGLLRVVAILGLLITVFGIVAGKAQADHGPRWFVMMVVMFSLMIVPKVDVVITDRTGTSAPTTVQNVPLGLAFLSASTSKIGDWFTRGYETVFSLPSDTRFQTNGLMFGNKIVAESRRFVIADPGLKSDLAEFINNCTLYDLAAGRIDITALSTTSDVWGMLGNTSAARMVTYANGSFMDTCRNAYINYLNPRILSEVNAAKQRYGSKLFPGVNAVAASSLLETKLSGVYANMMNISQNSSDIITQNMAINLVRESGTLIGQKAGDASTTQIALAQAQAEATSNLSYATMAKVAEGAMPKIRNVIELVLYALFPIVMVFVVVSGTHSGTVVKAYVLALLNVQLWPPLYAVLNFVATSSSAASLTAVASATGGMSIQTAVEVGQTALSDSAIAGYMTLLIPVIAQAVVSGASSALSSFAGSVMQPAQGAAQNVASGVAQGNVSMGNVTMDSSSYNMHQANKRDVGYGEASGGARMTLGDGRTIETSADGSRLATTGRLKNDTAGIQLLKSLGITSTQTLQASKLDTLATSQRETATAEMSSVMGDVASKAWSRGGAQALRNVLGSGEEGGSSSMAQRVISLAQQYANNRSASTGGTAASTASWSAGGEVSYGTPGGNLSPVSARGSLSGQAGQNAVTSDDIRNAMSFLVQSNDQQVGQQSSNFMKRFTSDKSFANDTTSNQEDRKSLEARMQTSLGHMKQAEESRNKADELRRSADVTNSQGLNFSNDVLQDPKNRAVIDTALEMRHRGQNDQDIRKYLLQSLGGDQPTLKPISPDGVKLATDLDKEAAGLKPPTVETPDKNDPGFKPVADQHKKNLAAVPVNTAPVSGKKLSSRIKQGLGGSKVAAASGTPNVKTQVSDHQNQIEGGMQKIDGDVKGKVMYGVAKTVEAPGKVVDSFFKK